MVVVVMVLVMVVVVVVMVMMVVVVWWWWGRGQGSSDLGAHRVAAARGLVTRRRAVAGRGRAPRRPRPH